MQRGAPCTPNDLPKVAVLLATYNGSQFIETQIRSLGENATPFTLHWLDDHSTDDTREIVRRAAQSAGVELSEWHQPQHLGVPSSFFQLMECVEADIYLFCDQDDIWQPGKIDATVASLLPDVTSPVLCFAESLLFNNDTSEVVRPLSDLVGKARFGNALKRPATFGMFSPAIAPGHNQGFTRPVREMFLKHKAIARAHAFCHDFWLYDITIATGTVRLLSEVPTVLWRQHASNVSHGSKDSCVIRQKWRKYQLIRQLVSRHARGFILAAPTLTPSPTLNRLCELARLASTIDQRQTAIEIGRLIYRDVTPPILSSRVWLFLACLCTDAPTRP